MARRAPLIPLLVALASACGARAPRETLRLYPPDATARLDPNGFLLNPRWLGTAPGEVPNIEQRCRFRVATAHLERRTPVVTRDGCLSEDERRVVTLNEAAPTLVLGAVCVTGGKTGNVRGHVNWFPVTATGLLRWDSYSPSAVTDQDVTLRFLTRAPNAVAHANEPFGAGDDPSPGDTARAYHIEFYNRETLERLPDAAHGFWRTLKSAMLSRDAARALLKDRVATVTGVFGVDGVHGFQSELHPVFAISVLAGVERSADRVTEQWAVMVRNLGSEGDCSSGTLPLVTSPPTDTVQDFVVDLGAIAGAERPDVRLRDAWTSDARFVPRAEVVAEASGAWRVYVHVRHPRPRPAEPDYLFLGTIEVERAAQPNEMPAARLASWLPPADARPPVQLPSTGAMTRLVAPEGGPPPAVPLAATAITGSPGATALVRQRPVYLAPIPAQSIVDDAATHAPPTIARAERTPGWPLFDSVLVGCVTEGRRDPMCRSGERITLGATYSDDGGLRPFAALYLFPHRRVYEQENSFLQMFLHVLGYRFDVRRDRYVPFVRRDSAVIYEAPRDGWSLRASPFVSPNTVRLGDHVVLMPYSIANVGVSTLGWRRTQLAGGLGGGLHAQLWYTDVLAEAQRLSRAGHYGSQWTLSLAALAPIPGPWGRR
ncbi:hypothetical protein J421_5534 (plasmid) [Gemmatirosa kalamazoonensis]|uniref:Lipoprotein n=1 Tax=Gemmatirosa kalamazoonensis TaxID=861299 RepID=W0RPZ1_9BACT|nr:hypothetical protein [Gemmatirosa kalamazoonensis]AHG93069.1 hypothetical protein J421_5534 [Gemmatirosa kalamazoonensis]